MTSLFILLKQIDIFGNGNAVMFTNLKLNLKNSNPLLNFHNNVLLSYYCFTYMIYFLNVLNLYNYAFPFFVYFILIPINLKSYHISLMH